MERRRVLIDQEGSKPGSEMLAQRARAAELLKDPECEFIMIALATQEARDIEAPPDGYSHLVGIIAARKETLKHMLPEVIHAVERIAHSTRMSQSDLTRMLAQADAERRGDA